MPPLQPVSVPEKLPEQPIHGIFPGHKLEVETANHKYGQMVADERQSLRSIARDPERAVRRGYLTTTV